MYTDKRKIFMGILFLFFTVICIIGIVTKGVTTYYITGSIIFTIIGLGCIRTSRYR